MVALQYLFVLDNAAVLTFGRGRFYQDRLAKFALLPSIVAILMLAFILIPILHTLLLS